MGTIYGGMTFLLTTAWSMVATKMVPKVASSKKCLLMKSPIFFSKGRTVRFWIQIVLVLALVRIALVPSALYANPAGEQVVGGAAAFNRPDAATLIVNQNTDRAVINWNSFSIANGELTKFVQPSSSSAVLNRVVTANPSAIYG
ncbi:MAG: filamentous hemagglutinin N-terminal domain-containing protein, partial [Actinobacteria bacterium]|nr:filamentous hemagglutinin N-terminal domain-containing protein [Actinomycetota bacterium]